jgi:hypothetical protein
MKKPNLSEIKRALEIEDQEFNEYVSGEASPKVRRKFDDDFAPDNERNVSLREYGRPRSYTNINHVRPYLESWPNLPDPSTMTIAITGSLPYQPIHDYLINTGWKLVLQYSQYRTKEMQRPGTALYISDKVGYMLEICLDYTVGGRKRRKNLKKLDCGNAPCTIEKHPDYQTTEGDIITIDDAMLFSQVKGSEHWDEDFVVSLIREFEKHEKPSKNEEAEVSIIVINQGDYDIRSFSLEDANTTFEYPDLHYGEGFENFHGELLKRVDDESKGLILFHGQPGTGKTQYIRHLLKELCSANKAVLYSPPAVSASLAEPQMINFISDWIMGERRDCILLIEDAEPLLESRSGGVDGRSTGISNLLNITDGILNDILGLMVIATFNIEISKIDPALLRPGRLIARKEFKKMDMLQTENLATTLGMEKPDIELDKYPITLAEFYNNRKAKNVLTHDYTSENKPRIGFRTH